MGSALTMFFQSEQITTIAPSRAWYNEDRIEITQPDQVFRDLCALKLEWQKSRHADQWLANDPNAKTITSYHIKYNRKLNRVEIEKTSSHDKQGMYWVTSEYCSGEWYWTWPGETMLPIV
jgi:hypothetical protein